MSRKHFFLLLLLYVLFKRKINKEKDFLIEPPLFRFVQMQFHKGFDSIRLQTEIRYIMVDGLVTNYTILFCTLGSSCGSRPLIFCGLATERK